MLTGIGSPGRAQIDLFGTCYPDRPPADHHQDAYQADLVTLTGGTLGFRASARGSARAGWLIGRIRPTTRKASAEPQRRGHGSRRGPSFLDAPLTIPVSVTPACR